MRYFNFILTTIVLLLVMLSAKLYFDNLQMRKENPTTTNFAVRPDNFLESANRDIKRHYFKTGEKDIEKAIAAMRLIEKDIQDSVSKQAIEIAIQDLEMVEEEWKRDVVDHYQIGQVFTYALNSLAYAQMRVSEAYCEKGEMKEAKFALKYALEHLRNATRYSDEMEREIELEVYTAIDSLIANDLMDDNILRQSVEALLLEMDTTVMQMRY